MMKNDDLISRKALLKALDVSPDEWAKGRTIIALINAAPTVDAVKVVRCKDCKFSKPLENIPSHRYCIALKDVFNFGDDFYCARGAKMEDKK